MSFQVLLILMALYKQNISKMQNILEREDRFNAKRELVIMKWREDIVNESVFSVGKVIE